MHTMQLAEALYAQDSGVTDSDVYGHLQDLKRSLCGPLDRICEHWDANKADAEAHICPEGLLEAFQQMISAASQVLISTLTL